MRNTEALKLTEKDLEEVGTIYDEVRDIYKSSKYFVDKELAEDFDKNVEAIMSDLREKMNKAPK